MSSSALFSRRPPGLGIPNFIPPIPPLPFRFLLHHGILAGLTARPLLLHLLVALQLLLQGRAGASFPADIAAPPGAVFRGSPRRLRVLLQGLQLGQGDDVAVLGMVLHRPLRGGIVVVEAGGVGVEELPPLVLIGAFDPHPGGGVPHALPRDEVGVHALPGPRLDDFHPFQPGKGQGEKGNVNRVISEGHPNDLMIP